MRRILIMGHYASAVLASGLLTAGHQQDLLLYLAEYDIPAFPIEPLSSSEFVARGKPRAKVFREQQSRSHKPRDMYRKGGKP